MGILNVTPDSFCRRRREFRSRTRHSPRAADGGRRRRSDRRRRRVDASRCGGRPRSGGAAARAAGDRSARARRPRRVGRHAPPDGHARGDRGRRGDDQRCRRAAARRERWRRSPASGAAVCLVHMQGEPATMQQAPHYGDVVREVREFLAVRARACEAAGIARERIVVDPGFGFGKTLAHNLALLRALPDIAAAGYPVLAGLSRKSSLGTITGRAGRRAACRRAWRRRWRRSRAAPRSCGCTTCAKRSTPSKCGLR